MIDIHLHIGRLYMEPPLTAGYLLKLMDKHGIEKACLLPMENPEFTSYYVTTEEVLRACKRHPDRFIPFCNVDPRRKTDLRPILEEYRDRGCRGFGEGIAALPIDEPRLMEMYAVCGEFHWPVILDIMGVSNIDDAGFPRFNRMLCTLPDTIFLGHAMHFWAEISGDARPEQFNSYPTGPVTPGGTVPRMLREHPNLYGDISAGSGFNALTRDREFGYRFLEEFQDKLVLGTDICRYRQDTLIVPYLKDALATGKLSQTAFQKITRLNTERVLGM
ncbi:MAG: amidohydrolase family protein [Armatimonadota bacterium]